MNSKHGLITLGALGLLIFVITTFKSRISSVTQPSPICYSKGKMSHLGSTTSETIKSRLATLHNGCQNFTYHRMTNTVFLYSKQHSAAACKSAKTGSSFLGTVFLALESLQDVDNVFHIDRNLVHYRVSTISSRKLKEIRPSTTIMVSRDPFQRLFSVYVDKVFLLGRIGRLVQTFSQTNTRKRDEICGYNVTFQNFVDMVLSGYRNEHWEPLSKLCDPCNVNYQVVCKTETLTEDTEYVLDRLNLTEAKRHSIKSMLHSRGLRHKVYSLVAAYISDYKKYKTDCPDVNLLYKKIWKVFQIQGYVHDSVSFPRGAFSEMLDLNQEKITDIILNGIKSRPLSHVERFHQRLRHFVDGYTGIKLDTLRKLQKLYYQDFILFGYNMEPPRYEMYLQ